MSHRNYPKRITRSAYGIRAQDLRTLVKSAWWARRWIAALEGLRLGPRLGRGRQYAAAGQVTELVLQGPHAEAVVTGSRAEPYRLAFDFRAAEPAAAARIAARLRAEPMLLARVLTDDLPTEVEAIFREEGAPFFPTGGFETGPDGEKIYDIRMTCSCPDWSRPCKHLVAVLFLLGEEVARRPATLLALRGVDVFADLPPPAEDAAEFVSCAPVPRLGPVPYWRGTARCLDALARMAQRAKPVALAAAKGESIDLRHADRA